MKWWTFKKNASHFVELKLSYKTHTSCQKPETEKKCNTFLKKSAINKEKCKMMSTI